MTTLQALNQEIAAFFAPLWPGENKPLVFGEGPENAHLMLVGEAPGEQEALAGKPFVGKAGQVLDAFLRGAGVDRAQAYVTNTVKIRPTRKSAAGRTVNRPPTREEIELFLPFLRREIDGVRPRLIVTMGNVPLGALLGRGAVIGRLHGQTLDAGLCARVYAMYHPAALIYNRALTGVYEQDMERLSRVMADLTAPPQP